MRVAMIGAGYVGLVSGACFADFGHQVTCIDKDATRIDALKRGEIPIFEPGLSELVESNVRQGRLEFATEASRTGEAHAIFIAVGTPSRRGDGHADLSFVYQAVREIAPLISSAAVVITKSTVPVGTGDEIENILREKRPDVIHVHKGVAHAIALAATARDPVGAFVVNRGVSFPLDVWNRGKYRTRRVDRVVTVCQQIKDVIVSSGRLPDAKVTVVFAGTDVALFDPDRWDPRAFRREKGIGDDRFLVAQVGVREDGRELLEGPVGADGRQAGEKLHEDRNRGFVHGDGHGVWPFDDERRI